MKFKQTIIIDHNKPFTPSKENALTYIEQTFKSTLSKVSELEILNCEPSKKGMALSVDIDIDVEDMYPERLSTIVNRVNKTLRNISKKYNTDFHPLLILN